MVYGLILNPARVNRLVEHHARDASQPGLESVLDKLINTSFKKAPKTGYEGAVQMSIDGSLFFNLAQAATSKEVSLQSRAIIAWKLDQLRSWLQQRVPLTADESWKAFYSYMAATMGRLKEKPDEFKSEYPFEPPPGMPIGSPDTDYCGN
jgi:hypothetical protein